MSGRIRTVKPEWLEDEALLRCSSDARVASIALLLLADDHGNGRGSDLYLGAQIFPGEPLAKVREALASLVAIRYAAFYEVDGQTYYTIRNWTKHQRVDKPGKPRVPEPLEIIRDTRANIRETLAGSSRLTPTPTPICTTTPTTTGSDEASRGFATPETAPAPREFLDVSGPHRPTRSMEPYVIAKHRELMESNARKPPENYDGSDAAAAGRIYAKYPTGWQDVLAAFVREPRYHFCGWSLTWLAKNADEVAGKYLNTTAANDDPEPKPTSPEWEAWWNRQQAKRGAK